MMNIGIARRRMIAIAAAAAATVAVAACAEDDDGTNGTDPAGNGSGEIQAGLNITFLPKQVNNPYFDTSNSGGEEAVGEFGGNFSETGPSEASPSAEVSYIETLAQQEPT